MLKAQTIRNHHADLFTFLHGDLGACASACHRPEETGADSLVFVSQPAQLAEATRRNAAIIIVQEKLAPLLPANGAGTSCCFAAPAIPMAMAVLLRYFEHKAERFTQWGVHHPTALVHASATLGQDVVLGPYCVIGARSSIGDGCLIGAHVVVENDVRIGPGTILHPHVFVGAGCEVGGACEIHPHTTIGSDGYGYVKDAAGRPRKVPQLGNVKIGDEVEIGGNCSIDRATLTSTHIRSGAKLDNICHIAHNCDLGENGLYTAGFMMAGSTTIGRNFVTGGNSVVSAHLTLADNVELAGRSTVTHDVTQPGHYGGYPLQPLREALKTLAAIGHLNDMRKSLNRLLRTSTATAQADSAVSPAPER
ncbi:MAG TPA: UDP-3-O-(3-hydroxymyristoyl)glucosamine N-acyltransferase [Steroidobacteraceae bacterium]|jgi:UDP-3-O-[3-hydroxymyristoyl] glucosamine N-acyltransferase|nr:UDP-3-O-(3-hydroxymyristoyl)glucosamine N-acyltransferase [Steroidobacteraceae bacterium]